jgi:signal transduction histidine kinase
VKRKAKSPALTRNMSRCGRFRRRFWSPRGAETREPELCGPAAVHRSHRGNRCHQSGNLWPPGLKDGQFSERSKDLTVQGRSAGRVLSFRDVTERHLAETLLVGRRPSSPRRLYLLDSKREARSEVERASRMKDEFLARLSHEFRTPLNAVLGWANILLLGKLRSEELKQVFETIERNARVQAQIIEDLPAR